MFWGSLYRSAKGVTIAKASSRVFAGSRRPSAEFTRVFVSLQHSFRGLLSASSRVFLGFRRPLAEVSAGFRPYSGEHLIGFNLRCSLNSARQDNPRFRKSPTVRIKVLEKCPRQGKEVSTGGRTNQMTMNFMIRVSILSLNLKHLPIVYQNPIL